MARSLSSGSSDVIAVNGAEVVTPNVGFTIAMWLKSAATNQQYPYSQGSSSSSNPFFALHTSSTPSAGSGAWQWLNNSGGSIITTITFTGLCDSTWHHACFTDDGAGNCVAYLDGASVGTATHSTASAFTTNKTAIGALARPTLASFYNGTIAEVATWTIKLTAGEVKALASGLTADHLGPNHYWPLWGVDSPEPDLGTG